MEKLEFVVTGIGAGGPCLAAKKAFCHKGAAS
jgi:hypothetical protein